MTADPSTLTDTEHAEVCAAWDAALERALASRRQAGAHQPGDHHRHGPVRRPAAASAQS